SMSVAPILPLKATFRPGWLHNRRALMAGTRPARTETEFGSIRCLCHHPQRRPRAQCQMTVKRHVVFRHPSRGESLLEASTDHFDRKTTKSVDRVDRASLVLDNIACEAVLDDFRDRSVAPCNDRRAAGHRFDHDQAKRFRP